MDAPVWLELPSGKSMPIEGTCAIGRARSNQLVLDDGSVSRHHAVIRMSDADECWIIDLGSANGTYVNERRVNALRLRDGDAITVGSSLIGFRSATTDDGRVDTGLVDTVHEVRQLPAWFIVVDIEGSTGIGRRLGPVEMERAFDDWLTRGKAILQDTGGILDKPLGDGFFAFWPTPEQTAGDVARALLDFRRFQSTTPLPFRMALHLGTAFTGGEISSGMYRLFGTDVTFTFRLEALTKALGVRCLLSTEARDGLRHHVTAEPAGSHQLPGLEGSYDFFRF